MSEAVPPGTSLCIVRREFEQSSTDTYVVSLSSRTIVYKGMFLVGQRRTFYKDLQNKDYQMCIRDRIETGLTPECERIYTTNLLLEMFHEDSYEDVEVEKIPVDDDGEGLEQVLSELLAEAVKRGIIEDSIGYRDLFETKMMNCLLPRPAQVQKEFWEHYGHSPEEATAYYYKFSRDSDYIRRYRVKKDMKWTVESPYGEIDITINLSKPEKDPKAIACLLYTSGAGVRASGSRILYGILYPGDPAGIYLRHAGCIGGGL